LIDSTRTTIPLPPDGHNCTASLTRVPGRSELRDAEVLRRGSRFKADVLRLDLGEGPLLIKDFAGKPLLGRLWGRLQIARELRAYRFMGLLPGVPRLAGRVDAFGLAVEWIDGELLAYAPNRVKEGTTHVRRLREVIDRLHAAGLVHLDLRSNKNVLLAADGRIVVVDFASAFVARPGGWVDRVVFPLLRRNDLTGYVKWKRTLQAGPLTGEEQVLLRRHERIRPVWELINPKRRR